MHQILIFQVGALVKLREAGVVPDVLASWAMVNIIFVFINIVMIMVNIIINN